MTKEDKEFVNKVCQLFMEYEAIESYNPDVIEWICNKMKDEITT